MVENYLKGDFIMKRNYLLIFSVFLFMFFCVNIDGVKAANDKGYIYCRYNIDNKCSSSNKKIKCTINIVVYNKDDSVDLYRDKRDML